MISGSELQEPFFRRLSKLDDVKEVQDEVAELCKPGALFVDDLALSTDSGSKIADYLCQVNPRAVMDLMKTECSSWGAEEWGRNAYSLPHLFWTLDKLLWWHTTFFDAAALLLDAIGKSTEAASRQAEEHFVALFRVNLPGTQSTLHERLRFLEQALDSDDEVKRRLIVRALGAGLTTGRVSRSGGIESQGSRKSQGDYRPATNNEILEYWGKCIDHLHKIIRSESELRELAMEELGNRLGGMVCEPMLDRLDNVVKDIAESPFGYWPDAAVSLNHFLGHDSSGHPKEVTERVTEWVRLLTPTTVENRLKLYVDTPARSHEKDSRGKYVDIAEAKAQVLAGELSTEGFDWTHYADLLLTGEQRQAMPFGERLAQLSPRKSSLLTSILTNLRGRDPRKTNLRLPAGFLWATQQADQIAFFDQLLSEQELLPFTMPLIAKGKPTVSHVRTLMRLVSDEKIPIEEFWHLQHSPFFDQLPETYRPEFLDNLVDLGIEGVRVAFEFVAFHCSYREEAFANYEIRIRSLLMTKGLALEAGDQGMFRYNVVENMIKYSKSKPDDLEFVEFLPAEILNLLENAQDYIEHDNDVGRLIRFLVDEHPALTWMSFGPCLLDEACPSQHVLLRLLGPRDYDDTSDSIAAHLPENLLKEWCHQNGAKAVITLTQIVPLLDSTNSWTDWAEFLFDEFHGEASVLNAVEFSIQPTSALGSFAPYYKARSDACRHLFNHKHARVRAWAERVASAYDRRAEREEAGDTERDWNYDW